MAKPKSPLLSLGARGTIGDTLTYQKRGQATIARTKPTPTDPYSLAQAYQRWLYQDYAYLWTQQSELARGLYRAEGSRHHLTGFQYWMKYQLANLPNIAGMWHLDYTTDAITPDSSKNNNHGTVYGATPVPGVISQALSFDGLNDYINCGNHPSLDVTSALTVEAWVKTSDTKAVQFIAGKGNTAADGWYFAIAGGNLIVFRIANGVDAWLHVSAPYGTGEWAHLAGVFDKPDMYLYVNGVEVDSDTFADDIGDTSLHDLLIGQITGFHADRYFLGIIDELRIYNRALDPTEIKRHSERRYPA